MNDRRGNDRLNNAHIIDQMYELVVDTVHTADNGCFVCDKLCQSTHEVCYKLPSGTKEVDAGLDTFVAEKPSCQQFGDGGNGHKRAGMNNDNVIMNGLARSTKNIEKILGNILNGPVTNPQRFTACVDGSESADHDESCRRETHRRCAMSPNVQLERLKDEMCVLEAKLEEQERASAEVTDLRLQLENLRRRMGFSETTGDRRPQQRFDNASHRMDALLSMYDRTLNDVDRSKRENHGLQCRVHAKTSEQTGFVDKIKRLEKIRTETAKSVRELCDKVHDEKARAETSTGRAADLEREVARKTIETDRARCELMAARAEADRETGRGRELRRDNGERCRELREVRAEGRRRAAALAAFRDRGSKRSAQAAGAADATAEELADARAAIQEWTDRRGRAADEHRRLLAVREEAACRATAEHRALEEQGRRSDGRLRRLSLQLEEARARRGRLTDAASAAADRLAGLTDAVRRLEGRASHERLVLTVKRTMAEGDKAVLQLRDTVHGLKMTMIGDRLDEVRTAARGRTEARQGPSSDATCCGDRSDPVG